MRIVAIDPGDVHCGWCVLDRYADAWHVGEVCEMTPERLLERLRGFPTAHTEVVVEEFRVYPHTATALIGSKLPTARLIGKIEYICQERGLPLIMQPAHILKAMVSRLELNGKTLAAVQLKEGGHAKDAEVHAYYRAMKGLPRAKA